MIINIPCKPGAVEELDRVDAGRAQLLAEILQKAEIRIDHEAERRALAGGRPFIDKHFAHCAPTLPTLNLLCRPAPAMAPL